MGMTQFEESWSQWLADAQGLLPEPYIEGLPALQKPLAQYYEQLMAVNRHTNLTRIDDEAGFLWRHILDSFTLAQWVPEGAVVIDLGTGAGFPAVPLALLRPDVTVHAVDSVQKKCTFLQSVVDTLGVSGRLTVHHARSEDLAHQPEWRGRFDIVTARAVAALPTLLELAIPFLKEGGQFLAMKQASALEEECPQADKALRVLGATWVATEPWAVPIPHQPELSAHVIGRFMKISDTPAQYPRLKNKPRKTPIV